jgi:kynurenine formamidase
MKKFMKSEIAIKSNSYWSLLNRLQEGTFVDLTHAFDSTIPHFKDAKPMQVQDIRTREQGGFWVQYFEFEGQWGTHVDAPAHYCEGKRTIDQIDVKEMLLPLVVLDIHKQVEKNSDYILRLSDIYEWEQQYGPIPEGAFVALRTDWSKRWPDNKAMHNIDEQELSHTPGWSRETLAYLYEECRIKASGHETIDPDPGLLSVETHWECERYILERNCYQIELMTNLDKCPPYGALLVCSFPKPKNASGFPARLFAICPPYS